jgi:hypothetical protein
MRQLDISKAQIHVTMLCIVTGSVNISCLANSIVCAQSSRLFRLQRDLATNTLQRLLKHDVYTLESSSAPEIDALWLPSAATSVGHSLYTNIHFASRRMLIGYRNGNGAIVYKVLELPRKVALAVTRAHNSDVVVVARSSPGTDDNNNNNQGNGYDTSISQSITCQLIFRTEKSYLVTNGAGQSSGTHSRFYCLFSRKFDRLVIVVVRRE